MASFQRFCNHALVYIAFVNMMRGVSSNRALFGAVSSLRVYSECRIHFEHGQLSYFEFIVYEFKNVSYCSEIYHSKEHSANKMTIKIVRITQIGVRH